MTEQTEPKPAHPLVVAIASERMQSAWGGTIKLADLTDEELRLIPHLVMARAITRALLSIWRARLLPEKSPYLLRNTAQGWAQLAWFMQRSVEQVSDTLIGFAAPASRSLSA